MFLRGKVSPSSLRMTTSDQGIKGFYSIKMFENSDPDKVIFCSPVEIFGDKRIFAQAQITSGDVDVKVIIEAVGYQTLLLNRKIASDKSGYLIDIGEVVLQPIQLPGINSVHTMSDADGNSQYRIYVANVHDKEFVVSRIRIGLKIRLEKKNSFLFSTSAPVAVFTVAPSLSINARDEILFPIGSTQNPGYYTQGMGKMRYQEGSTSVYLEFSFDSRIDIQKRSEMFFDIVIPSHFKVDNNGKSDLYLLRPPTTTGATDFNSRIERFAISLMTTADENTEIEKEI